MKGIMLDDFVSLQSCKLHKCTQGFM